MDRAELKFTRSHEWMEPRGHRRKVGISDFAQEQMGDIVYVEFPEEGKEVHAGEEVCVIESCKATASVYATASGKIVRLNKDLVDAPEKINKSPYDEGWLYEIEIDPEATDDASLMDLTTYLKTTEDH